eukprot:TRINITY_DN6475_c0_g1_i1.p1 TRINITY_DN6475_c0_g1~~TRINITY_DN6475_c0_g1_i1.p1  ORF type:complete len:1622 (+),score=112.25 TRINITY_DN6475_c0_g1_i1:41-4906(+)
MVSITRIVVGWVLLVTLFSFIDCQGYSVSYRLQNYDFRNEKRTSLIFNSQMDTDAVLDYTSKCGAATGDVVVFDCCPGSASCFTPAANHTCLSAAPATETIQVTPSTHGYVVRSYQFQIDNPVACNVGFISIQSDLGAVYINAYGGTIPITTSPRTTSTHFCCSLFSTSSPVVITVDVLIYHKNPPATITYTLNVDTSPVSLPLSRYYPLAKVSVWFSQIPYAYDCDVTGDNPYCNPLLPVLDDLLYYNFNRAVLTDAPLTNDRVFNWEFICASTNIDTGEYTEVISPDLFLDGTTEVSVQFNNIYNSATAPRTLLNAVVLASVESSQCNYSSDYFNQTVKELSTAQAALDNAFPLYLESLPLPDAYDPYQISVYWSSAAVTAPVVKTNWMNCLTSMQNTLLNAHLLTTTFVTKQCQQEKGTPEYTHDPCCNFTLLATQCCGYSSFNTTRATYITSDARSAASCSADGLTYAQTFLKTYVESQTASEKCIDDVLDVNPSTVAGIYDTCYGQLMSSYCYSDYDCIAKFGEKTFCSRMPGTSSISFGASRSVFPSRMCRWMCTTNADCLFGTCIDMGNWSECHYSTSQDPYTNPNTANQMSSCIASQILTSSKFFQRNFRLALNFTIAQFTKTNIQQAIYSTTVSSSPCSVKFFPEYKDLYACGGYTTSAQSCNWQNFLYDTNYPYDSSFCLTTNTLNPTPNYCGMSTFERPLVTPDVTQNGDCFLLVTFAQYGSGGSLACRFRFPNNTAVGPTKWGPAFQICNWQTSPVTQNNCLMPMYCPASTLIPINSTFGLSHMDRPPTLINGNICLPRCIHTTATDPTSCTNSMSTASWIAEGNFCELPAATDDACFSYQGQGIASYWWKGAMYYPPQYSTTNCQSQCLSDKSKYSASGCNSVTYCSNPFCPKCISTCASSGYCSALPGCYFPLNPTDYSCPVSDITATFLDYGADLPKYINWTPLGCTVNFPGGFTPITQATCAAHNGYYISYATWASMTKDQCEALPPTVCQVGGLDVTSIYAELKSQDANWKPQHHPPPGITFTDSDACSLCGGKSSNFFQWIPGKLINNPEQWKTMAITSRALNSPVIPNPPFNIITKASFLDKYQKVDYFREVDLSKQRTTCYWSTVSNILPPISCLCRGSNSTSATLCDYSGSTNPTKGTFQVCTGLSQIIEKYFGTVVVADTFVSPTASECVDVVVADNYLYQDVITPSLIVFSTGRNYNTQYEREKNKYIKNKHNIIIGQLLSGGTSFSIESGNTYLNGVSFCLSIPDNSTYTIEPRFNFPMRNIGRALTLSNSTYGPFEIMDLQMNFTNGDLQGCFPLDTNYTYFPIALVEDSLRNEVYPQTMSPKDLTAATAAIIIYAIAIALAWIVVALEIRISKQICHMRTWVKQAAAAFSIAFALRIGYCVWVMSDPQNDTITVIFIELPSQILWTLACLLLTRWISQSRKDKFKLKCGWNCCITLLGFYIYLIVIANGILFIIYLANILSPSPKSSPYDPLGDAQTSTSSVWFAVYVCLCVPAFIWFVIIGVSFFLKKSVETKSSQLKWALLLTIVTTVVVFASQSFILSKTFLWVTPQGGDGYYSWSLFEYLAALLVIDMFCALLLTIISWLPTSVTLPHSSP